MAKYQIYFDTVRGETRYNVDIDDEESLDQVLEEILYDLQLAKDCVLSGAKTSAILSPAIVELLRKYQEHRTLLLGAASARGKKPYPAPHTGI